jgi:hypothetical protein
MVQKNTNYFCPLTLQTCLLKKKPLSTKGKWFSTVEGRKSAMNGASRPTHLQACKAVKSNSHKTTNIQMLQKQV